MNKDLIKIESYKKIDLFYSKNNGRIYFNFEDRENEVKYIFEARQIIDEPIWEECDLKGYWKDGVFKDYIGKAIATRKNRKNNIPDWKYKGKYDTDYKYPSYSEREKVYLLNKENSKIYQEYEEQRDIFQKEERKLRSIIDKLK